MPESENKILAKGSYRLNAEKNIKCQFVCIGAGRRLRMRHEESDGAWSELQPIEIRRLDGLRTRAIAHVYENDESEEPSLAIFVVGESKTFGKALRDYYDENVLGPVEPFDAIVLTQPGVSGMNDVEPASADQQSAGQAAAEATSNNADMENDPEAQNGAATQNERHVVLVSSTDAR